MTTTEASTTGPRILMADRGDQLVGPLLEAMRARFEVDARVGAELSTLERLVVGAATFRPGRRRWVERYYKSDLGVRLRSRRARVGVRQALGPDHLVFQTHALFDAGAPRTVLYVDCTHRQSMRQWPAWNPLRGRALRRWLDRELQQYRAAAHVFAFSEETRASLLQDYDLPASRVTVVGAGLNFDALPEPRGVATGPPTVLFVGNDFVRKGGPELLEAFALVRSRMPRARLVIVGTPHPVGDQPGVEHLGRIHDREQMSRVYRDADVFCLPSHFDPFPGVVLEAMAHQLPCVVSATCGVPDMVVDGVTAIVLDDGPTLVTDLATALEGLLRDPARCARMGDRGRGHVAQHHLWSHVLDRMAPTITGLHLPPVSPPLPSGSLERPWTPPQPTPVDRHPGAARAGPLPGDAIRHPSDITSPAPTPTRGRP